MDVEGFKVFRDEVIQVLENNGIVVEIKSDDADVSDYNIDSLTFISFIVDLEEHFGISFPDDYLNLDVLKSINGLTNLLIELREQTVV